MPLRNTTHTCTPPASIPGPSSLVGLRSSEDAPSELPAISAGKQVAHEFDRYSVSH